MTKPKTVTIRICVAVNEWADGVPGYNAAGWSGTVDEALEEVVAANRCGIHEPQYRWVEAEVRAWEPEVSEAAVKGREVEAAEK